VEELDEDTRRVGVVGELKGARVMDTTLEIICERCARSLGMLRILDGVEAEAGSEQ
jgi:hypothetical protein